MIFINKLFLKKKKKKLDTTFTLISGCLSGWMTVSEVHFNTATVATSHTLGAMVTLQV